MTKAALCVHCADIFSPYRAWQTNRAWRWCQCGHTGVRWRDGERGLIEVSSLHGEDGVRVIGINNSFLEAAVALMRPGGLMAEEWRELHDASTEAVEPYYLFHREKRNCWALIVRVGESGDVAFVDYATATSPPPRPSTEEETHGTPQ